MEGALDWFSPAHVGALHAFSSGVAFSQPEDSTRLNAGQVVAGVAQLQGLSSIMAIESGSCWTFEHYSWVPLSCQLIVFSCDGISRGSGSTVLVP